MGEQFPLVFYSAIEATVVIFNNINILSMLITTVVDPPAPQPPPLCHILCLLLSVSASSIWIPPVLEMAVIHVFTRLQKRVFIATPSSILISNSGSQLLLR